MKKTEIKGLMDIIKELYGDKFPKLSTEMIITWYEYLKDLDIKVLQKALKNHVRKSEFPPTIAALRKEYDEIMRSRLQENAEIERLYCMTVALYPTATNSVETRNAWQVAMDKGTGDRVQRAMQIMNSTCKYVKECEDQRKSKLEPLSEYLRGGQL